MLRFRLRSVWKRPKAERVLPCWTAAGRVDEGYVALFAASNSETVEWATLRNSHYNCSDGDHKSCHPSIIASTDEHGRGACESSSTAAF